MCSLATVAAIGWGAHCDSVAAIWARRLVLAREAQFAFGPQRPRARLAKVALIRSHLEGTGLAFQPHEMISTPSHPKPAVPRAPVVTTEGGKDKAPESVQRSQPQPTEPTTDDWYDNVACTD